MQPPATVESWLSPEELQVWVREAPDGESYQRRLAVRLTQMGQFPAHQIAEWLCVSKQAIWLWISQYNSQVRRDWTGRGGAVAGGRICRRKGRKCCCGASSGRPLRGSS